MFHLRKLGRFNRRKLEYMLNIHTHTHLEMEHTVQFA